MKITALEEYGLRCMMQLALNASREPMTVAEVAEREGMSSESAGKTLNLLAQASLVKSIRGRNGGFVLSRTADEISLADIITALSTDLFDSEYCDRYSGAEDTCVHQTSCALRPVWSTLSAMVGQVLGSFSLMDLLRTERQLCNDLQPHLDALPERIEMHNAPPRRLHSLQVVTVSPDTKPS